VGDVKDRQQLRSVGAGHAVTRGPARRPPTTVTQSPVLRLQALAGNRAVAQLLGAGPSVQRCGGDTDCGCVHDDQDDAGQGGSAPPVGPSRTS